MAHVKVLAFFDPIAGVWLKPLGFLRPSQARDYAVAHADSGGEIPELGEELDADPIPIGLDSYRFVFEQCKYLVIGVRIEAVPEDPYGAEHGYDWEGGLS